MIDVALHQGPDGLLRLHAGLCQTQDVPVEQFPLDDVCQSRKPGSPAAVAGPEPNVGSVLASIPRLSVQDSQLLDAASHPVD